MSGVITGKVETRTMKIVDDLSNKEGYFVNLSTTNDNEIDGLASDATKHAHILLEGLNGSASAPKYGAVATGGITKVKLGGAVTVNSFLVPDANGEAVAASADNQIYGAIALENGADGDVIACKVEHGTFVIA